MATRSVAGFLPSTHGFSFANRWPAAPARRWRRGMLELGIGDTSRGLCGGMVFAARDRFERGDALDKDATGATPDAGSGLFAEIVDRQFDSFGVLGTVPLRFWVASALYDEPRRVRETIRRAWPAIRSDINAGRPSMVGLVRQAGWNPLAVGLGHQVLAYRYEASRERVRIGVYDPNHPGDDTVELRIERSDGGAIRISQSTGEPLLGLLHLPYAPPRRRG